MRVVHDRERKRPGFQVTFSWGQPDESEEFGWWLSRVTRVGLYTVLSAMLIGLVIFVLGSAAYKVGGLPLAIVVPTGLIVSLAIVLSCRLVWISRYRYEGPISHRSDKVVIHSSEEAIRRTLGEAILEFEALGFDGFLGWTTWRRDNHSRYFYQAMVDSLDRLTDGSSPLLAGNMPSQVAQGLRIDDITRNIQQLNSLAYRMFRVVHMKELLLVYILYAVSIPMIAGTLLAVLHWFSRSQQGLPLW